MASTVNNPDTKQVDLDKLANEFLEVDFHPNEARPPDRYMYSAYFDNLRHTMNTYLRRPIKKPFVSNTKKIVFQINRNEDPVLEMAYPPRTEQEWRAETQMVLHGECDSMFFKGGGSGPKKAGVLKANKSELVKYSLLPFYRTREFRKKIAFLYYPCIMTHLEEANGRFPIFKLSKNAHLKVKPGTASSNSIRNHANNHNVTNNNGFRSNYQMP